MFGTIKRLFERLDSMLVAAKELVPGLKNLWPEVKAECSRLGTQGTMELASAIFHGDGFVPYGPGQYTPSPEQGHQAELESALFQGGSFGAYGPEQDNSAREHDQQEHEHRRDMER
jgi:hypothetical protein